MITSIKDRTTAEGTDTLQGIETIQFCDNTELKLDIIDGVVDLDASQLQTLVEVYIAYFNRAPDALGLFYWADQWNAGLSLSQISQSFFAQPETQSIYANQTDSDFVSEVYQNYLGRDAEQSGKDYWTTQLENNQISTDSFLLAVINGAQSSDRNYIDNKTDLGIYYSAILGMNNIEHSYDVMNNFTGSAQSFIATKKAIDNYHASALSSENGELLTRVVGVIDDPFIG